MQTATSHEGCAVQALPPGPVTDPILINAEQPKPQPKSDLDEATSDPEYTPPNGGAKAWTRTFAAWLVFLIAWGPPLTFGDFQAYYASGPLASKKTSDIAWIGSLTTLLLITSGVVTGPLFDRGYLKQLMVLGCFCLVLGYMMTSLCTEYYQFVLAQGICAGVGSGLLYVPALAFVSTSFTTKRPIAVGITTTGTSVGGIMFLLIFRKLLPLIGFPWTVRVMGFIQLGIAIVALAILADAPVIRNKPRSLLDMRALKETPFIFMCLMFFCHFLSFWIPLFFIPLFSIDALGSSPDLASHMLIIANAGTFFGRLIPALLAQRWGAMNVIFVVTLIVAVITFAWIGVHDTTGMIVWSCIWGVASGGFSTIDPVVATHPVMSPSMSIVGTRLGMAWVAAGIGMLIGNPIAGALGGKDRGYLHAQIFAGVIMLAGWGFAIIPWWFIRKHDREKAKSEKTAD